MARTKTSREALKRAVLDLLDAAPAPMTVSEIFWALHPLALSESTVRIAAQELVETGEVRAGSVGPRTGAGRCAIYSTTGESPASREGGAVPRRSVNR